MNSQTLIASVIFAAVLVVVIAVVIHLMLRGWRRRALRQAELIGTLPPVPDSVGPVTVAPTRGLYVGCTLVPDWHDRVAVGDLGYRSKAVLTRYPEGIMVQRSGARPIWIPQESITAIRTERGMVGKVTTRDGILAIRWRLPSGTEIDTGFRGEDRGDYDRWLREAP
ncbi:transporter [Mycobacterium sp.]|uniref:PH-like domain-containing protein n=1 Tax=Mycobacterium sp. TaxID=1785 RepID=UPI0031D409B5